MNQKGEKEAADTSIIPGTATEKEKPDTLEDDHSQSESTKRSREKKAEDDSDYSEEGGSSLDTSDAESEGCCGGSVRFSSSDSEELSYKMSRLVTIPNDGQADATKSIHSFFESLGLWVCRSKEALKDMNDCITGNKTIRESDIPPSVPQGDQTETASGMGSQTAELITSLVATTSDVDRIGDIIKKMSEALKTGGDGATNTVKSGVEEMSSIIDSLIQKIPANIALLDSLSEENKEKCLKIWETITKDLDTINGLAESVQRNIVRA